RARETFEALVADPPTGPEALAAFRRLLEESREWARAVEIQELLLEQVGSGDDVVAHLLAEQALATLASDPVAARALAGRATSLAPRAAPGAPAAGPRRGAPRGRASHVAGSRRSPWAPRPGSRPARRGRCRGCAGRRARSGGEL